MEEFCKNVVPTRWLELDSTHIVVCNDRGTSCEEQRKMGFEIWMTSCNWNKLKHSSQCNFDSLFLPLFVCVCVLIRKIESQKLAMKCYNSMYEVGRRMETGGRKKEQNYKPLGRIECVSVRTQMYLPLTNIEREHKHVFSSFCVYFHFFAFLFIVICFVRIWTQRHHNIVYKKQRKENSHIHSSFAPECVSLILLSHLISW